MLEDGASSWKQEIIVSTLRAPAPKKAALVKVVNGTSFTLYTQWLTTDQHPRTVYKHWQYLFAL